jgi:hypothetical protein
MARRLWVIEGFASDGDVYGRALQLPGRSAHYRSNPSGNAADVQRAHASILKRNTADLASCPCFDAMQPDGASEDLEGLTP